MLLESVPELSPDGGFWYRVGATITVGDGIPETILPALPSRSASLGIEVAVTGWKAWRIPDENAFLVRLDAPLIGLDPHPPVVTTALVDPALTASVPDLEG